MNKFLPPKITVFLFVLFFVISCGNDKTGNNNGGGGTVENAPAVAAQAKAQMYTELLDSGLFALKLTQFKFTGFPPISFFSFNSSLKTLLKLGELIFNNSFDSGNFVCMRTDNGSDAQIRTLSCTCKEGGMATIVADSINQIETDSCSKTVSGTFTFNLDNCVIPSCGDDVGMTGNLKGNFTYERICPDFQSVSGEVQSAESCSGVTALVKDGNGNSQSVETGDNVRVNGGADNGLEPNADLEGSICTDNAPLEFFGRDDLFSKAGCPNCNNVVDLNNVTVTKNFNCTFGDINLTAECSTCRQVEDLKITELNRMSNGAVEYRVDEIPSDDTFQWTGTLCGDRFNWKITSEDFLETGLWIFSADSSFKGYSAYTNHIGNVSGGGGVCTYIGGLSTNGTPPPPDGIPLNGTDLCPGPMGSCP